MQKRIKLGVNIDHVATLRNARGEGDPSLVELAMLAQNAGADSITVHLREDRRHIRDADLFDLKKNLKIPINFEMALSDEILKIAHELRPATVCIVPERREEITTEGGLDAIRFKDRIRFFVEQLGKAGAECFLFIEPEEGVIVAAKDSGARGIEFHTGAYARAFNQPEKRRSEYERLVKGSSKAATLGLEVHAGHGLNYFNIGAIVEIPQIEELNIGHAIISRALVIGLPSAIREMRFAMRKNGD